MSEFRDSVKSALRQVFGHADIESVLNDDWDYDQDFPQHKRDAMRSRPQPAAATTRPMPAHRPPPSPTPRIDPVAGRPMNLAHIPESSLPPEADPPPAPAPVVDGRLLTEGAPHAADTIGRLMDVRPARRADELVDPAMDDDEFGRLLDAVDPGDLDWDDAPPNHQTLDITASHAPACPGPAPRLRLRPQEPAPTEAAPIPVRLEARTPVALTQALTSEESLDSTSLEDSPADRLADDGALPPADIWDDKSILRELLEDLAAEEARAVEPGGRRVHRALREALLEDDLDFPPFPPAARRLVGEGGVGPTDEDLLDIIRGDPSLAGKLIKVANSPFYLAAAPVASINSAVVRIGLDQVRRVMIAGAVGESYKVGGYESVMAKLRLHSVATGMAAELLAISSQVHPAEAFLAGLLHDVGEALVYRLVRKKACEDEARGDHWFPDGRVLRRVARRQHVRLGALFLKTWDLAATVASALAYHHHPELAEPRYLELVALVHIADELAIRAVDHVRSAPWRAHLALRALANSRREVSAAVDTDGVDELMVDDLLDFCPRGWDAERLRGVLRSVALRLDGNDLSAVDGSATLASMTL